MAVKYTLRNLNQLKRDLVIFESEYQNLIKHQHEDNEDNMSENYDICRRFIENTYQTPENRIRVVPPHLFYPSMVYHIKGRNYTQELL